MNEEKFPIFFCLSTKNVDPKINLNFRKLIQFENNFGISRTPVAGSIYAYIKNAGIQNSNISRKFLIF